MRETVPGPSSRRPIANLREHEIERNSLDAVGGQHISERGQNRAQQARRRARMTEEKWEAERERAHTRRICVRLGHALANHIDFNKSRVSGPDVEDDRHVLPPLEQCDKCRAWKWPAGSKMSCCLKGDTQLRPLEPVPDVLCDFYKDPHAFGMVSAGASDGKGHIGAVREDPSVQGGRGIYTYRMQGEFSHYLGTSIPPVDRPIGEMRSPTFAQIYAVDEAMRKRAERRTVVFSGLDQEIQ
ncbi:Helitron helicase [Phytophthora megakarya]|uniref:Helitron helicase n=1 Tax=Phytophthora megakarya TaxID=4795 RepID=A0A225UZ05_9STRA|nr:Helitron helicase [Phytophthora megakarya]